MENTEQKLIKAVEVISDKIGLDIKSNDALHYTQAMLNIANTILTIKSSNQIL